MEDVIIGLLFVYFFVIRPLLKQVRKGDAKKPGARPRAPLGMLLEKVKEKLREATEQAEVTKGKQPRERPAATWKDLFAEATRKPQAEPWETAPGSGDLGEWPVEEPWVPGEPEAGIRGWEGVRPAAPEPAPRITTPAVKAAAEPPQGQQVAPARRSALAGVNLRQAVVWSEILGPPVSLRDGD